ncbi:MAG: hypothetical protein WBQ39_07750 [Terriglobales bacterium]
MTTEALREKIKALKPVDQQKFLAFLESTAPSAARSELIDLLHRCARATCLCGRVRYSDDKLFDLLLCDRDDCRYSNDARERAGDELMQHAEQHLSWLSTATTTDAQLEAGLRRVIRNMESACRAIGVEISEEKV